MKFSFIVIDQDSNILAERSFDKASPCVDSIVKAATHYQSKNQKVKIIFRVNELVLLVLPVDLALKEQEAIFKS